MSDEVDIELSAALVREVELTLSAPVVLETTAELATVFAVVADVEILKQ